MPTRKDLFGYSLAALTEEMLAYGESKYRARQLFSWIYEKNVLDFDSMTDISKAFREVLKRDFALELPEIYREQDASDGTVKLLLELKDGAKVETVLMRYNYGNVACVSSQVGCNMGCQFCASGILKRERNLTAGEMVGEVLSLNKILSASSERITHVVVMGTGEPFDNYDAVMEFVRIMNEQRGLAIGARHITVSTCGIVPRIRQYGQEGLQINLAISLHAPNDEIRRKIMPIAKAYPIDELMDAVKDYEDAAGRRVTFEYILIKGLNDSPKHAEELASLIRKHGIYAYVNLIPLNPVKEKDFARPDEKAIHLFHDRLMKLGITTTIRKEFGTDIDAACGQLRVKVMKENNNG